MITLATYRRVHNYTVDGAENVVSEIAPVSIYIFPSLFYIYFLMVLVGRICVNSELRLTCMCDQVVINIS